MRGNTDILYNAVDMHVHAGPDLHPRLMSELEILEDAKAYGMRGIVSKAHYCLNADRAALINTMIEGIECFGGVVLNPSVGGLNPAAVEAAIHFGGKEIWMPSFYTRAHLEKFKTMKGVVKKGPEPISILKEGKLLAEVHEILDLIAEADVILGTSHCSGEEIRVLVKEAIKQNVKKILITHPHNNVPGLSLSEQLEMAEWGAYLELCLYTAMPISGRATIHDLAETIQKAGAQRVVLATDFGQPFHPTPAEGMRIFCENLLAVGIARRDIEIMIRENPAYLLGLS
jgi:hypothetical protein